MNAAQQRRKMADLLVVMDRSGCCPKAVGSNRPENVAGLASVTSWLPSPDDAPMMSRDPALKPVRWLNASKMVVRSWLPSAPQAIHALGCVLFCSHGEWEPDPGMSSHHHSMLFPVTRGQQGWSTGLGRRQLPCPFSPSGQIMGITLGPSPASEALPISVPVPSSPSYSYADSTQP
ncbi:hypothetical protein N658DRAFT_136176 [Parathielavia hyrcaniae]|uniref:Uncharacterized protein n=1 Tax=Parathielavia hyrcaniae TaxID=113614 RepID=A0AAN6Q903_9PEZI|nr:hypothetical protein N658DRAFT_136176 [Parathielavia hyrcaniae]